jgi:hypothetical protein
MTHRASYGLCCIAAALVGCWSSFERPIEDTIEDDGIGGRAGTAGEPIVEDAGAMLIDPSDRCAAEGALEPLAPRDDETCYELLTHNGSWEGDPFEIVSGEHMDQFYYEIPWPEGSVATRFGVQQDDRTSVHRWLLFESNSGSPGLIERNAIGTAFETDATLIAGWSVGGCNVELPSDMGIELTSPTSGKKLLAQWHYANNTSEIQHDASRIQICIVPRSARTHVGSVTVLGTEAIGGLEGMPVGVESTYSSACLNEAADPITVVAFWPHMHQLATSMRTELVSVDGIATSVFDKPFRHEESVHYAMTPRVVIAPGEKLRTSCTYFNSSPYSVHFGLSVVQETCYQFAFSYPAGALDKPLLSLIGATNICWGD